MTSHVWLLEAPRNNQKEIDDAAFFYYALKLEHTAQKHQRSQLSRYYQKAA